jgi:dimethylargininase
MRAFTRAVPTSLDRCLLTHIPREPIDIATVESQHRRYEEELRALGCTVTRLPAEPDLPDSMFVEDTAVVLEELAVITRPGAESRRAETAGVADALRTYRPLSYIREPGTLDGGDVLVIDKQIFAGLTARTNAHGLEQLRELVVPIGYTLREMKVRGCLHLKSAATQVASGKVVVNPAWVEVAVFTDLERIEVDPAEPAAANALLVGSTLLFPSAYPRTAARLRRHGVTLRTIDVSEIAKAEGGLTCCSIIVSD